MDIWETFGREAQTQRPPEVTTFFIGAKSGWFHEIYQCKEGCVFQMVAISILPHAEIRLNDHRESAPHFTLKSCYSVTLELTFHRHQVDMVSIYDFLVYQVLNIQPYDNELNLP